MDIAGKEPKSRTQQDHETRNDIEFPAIQQLQRRYGNRTLQRLLNDPAALQRAEPELAARLQRQDRPVRVPHRLQQQDVTITTVGTPQILPNGGFEWLVDFSLPDAAAGDGYIIQECRHNSTDLLTGNPLRPEWHYWEAWRVRAGALEPVERGANNCHDQFRYTVLTTTDRYVRHSIQGIVCFYETPDFPWGNDHPQYNPNHNFFHNLPRPTIWNGIGVRHEAINIYDARGSTPTNRLLLINGSQETRIGDW